MVTTVLLPATKRLKSPEERVQFFERIEAGFARQARWTVLITGLSGFYLVYRLDAWGRFQQASYWWMHAMALIWGLFTLMLFVLEPLWLHRWFERSARNRPEGTFRLIQRLHWLLLTISLLTIAGAVAGSHGWLPS
jgi:uncharacterized membrane protein